MIFAIVFGCVFVAIPCDAQPSVDAKAWLEKRMTIPYKMTTVENVKFTFSIERMPAWTDSELAAAQREVEGHSEHPKLFQVKREVARRKPGGDVETFRVWWKSASEYRVSWDMPVLTNMPWNDVACRKDESWQLTGERNLTIGLGASDSASIPATVQGVRMTIEPALRSCVQNYLSAFPVPVKSSFSVKSDGAWSGSVETIEGNQRIEFSGVWDAAAGRGQMKESVSADDMMWGFQSHRRVYKSWQRMDAINDYVATEILDYSKQGKLVDKIQFGPIERMTEEDFASAARTPSLTSEDFIRGKIVIDNIMDETKFTRTAKSFDPSGTLVGSVSTGLTRRGADRWQTAGWIALGVLVVVLGALRWRAFASSR